MINVQVPKYINTEYGRAFLTIGADIYGNWCAGYHRYLDGDEIPGEYYCVGPYINDAKSIEEALELLKGEFDADTEVH